MSLCTMLSFLFACLSLCSHFFLNIFSFYTFASLFKLAHLSMNSQITHDVVI
jgi:hypothetical protein